MTNLLDFSTFGHLAFAAGAAHMCQIPGMIAAPRMLDWKTDLRRISPINRGIFMVLMGGIVLTVLGSGVIVMLAHDEIASGSLLATCLTGFLAVFWSYRFAVQAVIYRRIWPGGVVGRGSHIGLWALFCFLSIAYWALFVHNWAIGHS